jgi:predicted dehydrogenase
MALRLGLVGRGRWGRNIERTLLGFRDVQVMPVARDQASPVLFDAVLIATPSATHAELALPYVEAGIPTFIEKPMATTTADAERIAAAASRTGTPVFVGHIYLYHPALLALMDALPALGAVRYLLCDGMNSKPRRDSSVLWDWLPHHLSMARAILRSDASSVETRRLAGAHQAEAAVSTFMFGRVPVVSVASWHSPVARSQMTVVCERGAITFDDKAERKLMLRNETGDVTSLEYSEPLPLTVELAAFLQVVRTGQIDIDHLHIGLAIVRQIAAAERSLNDGGRLVAIQNPTQGS